MLYDSHDVKENPHVLNQIYELARNKLPVRTFKAGRLLKNGHTGDGSETYDKLLMQYNAVE